MIEGQYDHLKKPLSDYQAAYGMTPTAEEFKRYYIDIYAPHYQIHGGDPEGWDWNRILKVLLSKQRTSNGDRQTKKGTAPKKQGRAPVKKAKKATKRKK